MTSNPPGEKSQQPSQTVGFHDQPPVQPPPPGTVYSGQPGVQQQQGGVVYIHHAPVAPSLGRYSSQLQCPHCQQTVNTEIVYKNGLVTWLSCGGIALLGCILGCCFIPFCINDLKDVQHICPNCKKVVGETRILS